MFTTYYTKGKVTRIFFSSVVRTFLPAPQTKQRQPHKANGRFGYYEQDVFSRKEDPRVGNTQ